MPISHSSPAFDPRDGGSRHQITLVFAVISSNFSSFALRHNSPNRFSISVFWILTADMPTPFYAMAFCLEAEDTQHWKRVLVATPSVTRVCRGATGPSGFSARHLPLLIGRLTVAYVLLPVHIFSISYSSLHTHPTHLRFPCCRMYMRWKGRLRFFPD